ncbi:hypothetical protein GSI_03255 [Ganoderma sinense ZZ0214-1]|uniref:Uncharacterized protein n=1 Tax=Ganoderma sinense ZZ0214-1 TaxID=1077348 RepID=A0A2G8SLM8_9APHY|nr:hypothetical protein GSI_03255 [Ganoderma sinense ZZ0214-1]
MPPLCRGKGGEPCSCSKFKKAKTGGRGCQTCQHSKGRHNVIIVVEAPPPVEDPPPPPSQQPKNDIDDVGIVLARHADKRPNLLGLGSPTLAISQERALQDVLPGYHNVRLPSSSKATQRARVASSSSSKKKKQVTKSVRLQQIGSLLFLLCGMWTYTDAYGNDKVELQSSKPPTGPEEEELRQEDVHLLVDEGATGGPLEFSPDWSAQAVDKWLRGIAPKLFQYLDLTFGVRDGANDQFHWRLVRQQNKHVFLYGKELVTGGDLTKCVGGQGRRKETFRLHFATRHPIDKSVWMNFDRAIRVAQKKPADPGFVDTIPPRPTYSVSSDSETSSTSEGESEGSVRTKASKMTQGEIEAAMEEAMEATSSEEDEVLLTKPKLAVKRPSPCLDADLEDRPEVNANGKRPAASPPHPYRTRLAKRAKRVVIESPEPEPQGDPAYLDLEPEPRVASEPEASTSNGVEDPSQGEGRGERETTPLFIDGVDFNVPSEPSTPTGLGFDYYYSPRPDSPPFPLTQPRGEASSSHLETKRTIRDSPGRPSRSAWKKRNPS